MIIKDLQPISFVEDSGFRGLMRLLCPSYLVPSKYISLNKFIFIFEIKIFLFLVEHISQNIWRKYTTAWLKN